MKYALLSHYRPEAQKWLVTHSQLFQSAEAKKSKTLTQLQIALCVQLIDPLAL